MTSRRQFPPTFAALAIIVCALTSCASSHVIVGKTRPPISPDLVKVYLNAPAKYEEIAMLEASSETSWALTPQGKMDVVVARLKAEAAALGANGILLRDTGSEYAGSVTEAIGTGNGRHSSAIATSTAVTHKTGSAVAIYVTD